MTKMVIFRLKTVLLWSHNKHKHFWRSLPAADHDSRDSRRRTSCVQCKKENAFSCSEQARNHCYALQHIFLGMLSRADVLSSCSSAARAHGGAASAGVTGVLSTAHQTNKLSLARETSPPKIWPHRISIRGQSFSASRLLIFNFFFYAMSSRWLRDDCGLELGPWSKPCGPLAPVMDRIISTFTWEELNQPTYKHTVQTWTVSAHPTTTHLLLDLPSILCVEIDSGLWCIIVVSANQITAVHERNPLGSPTETSRLFFFFFPYLFLWAAHPQKC